MLKTRNLLHRRGRWIQSLPFNYGWVIVFLGAFSMFATTPGQSDTFALFMDSFIEEFGWSRTFVSSLYASATLFSGLLMFLVGRLVDKIGSKWVAILSATVLGIACMLLSTVIAPWMLFTGFFLARLAGKGSLDLSASMLAPQWFKTRRAFAIMLVGLGGTAGGMLFPILNAYLINSFGWREAYRYLAGGLWLIYIPITVLFMINRPEDVGMAPDGKVQAKEDQEEAALVDDEVSVTQKQALKTSSFWILVFCVFQASMVGTGIVLHFVSIFDRQGFSLDFAAKILSAKTLITFITTILMGLLLDKIKRQHMILALFCILQAGSICLLPFLGNTSIAYLYMLLSGISGGVIGISINVLKPNLFGRRYLGGISSVIMAINVIGSAIGPVVFGAAFDLLHGYQEIILISAALPLLSGILSFFIRQPALQLKPSSQES